MVSRIYFNIHYRGLIVRLQVTCYFPINVTPGGYYFTKHSTYEKSKNILLTWCQILEENAKCSAFLWCTRVAKLHVNQLCKKNVLKTSRSFILFYTFLLFGLH